MSATENSQRRQAIWALALLLPFPSLGTAASLLFWPEAVEAKIFFAACKVWIVLLPLLWLKCMDHQPISLSPSRHGGFNYAVFTGLAIAGIILATYYLLKPLGFIDAEKVAQSAAKTGLNHLGFYLGGAVYWITLNSLMEEYVWRWFVFRKFEIISNGKLAVVASSLGFTAHHIVALAAQFDWTVVLLGSTGVFIGGLTWSWLYLRFRSIWPCYLSHAIVDMPLFWIGYDLIFRSGT